MPARPIASLTLSFALVSIPVRLYSATESSAALRFNLLTKGGDRVKQQYISEKGRKVVQRTEMVKGYEFEKDHFVLFTADEPKALEEGSSNVVDIVAFIPVKRWTPAIHFNYGIAMEDAGQFPAAVLSYKNAVALDAGFADAHFNLGRLREALGDARAALRRFNAYRRLVPES